MIRREELDAMVFGDAPTDEQRAAIRSDAAVSLIVSGPGTGKTTTMARRIGREVRSGTRPADILAICFTRAAAGELRRKLEADDVVGVPCMTFHEWAVRQLDEIDVASDEVVEQVIRGLYRGSRRVKSATKKRQLERDIHQYEAGRVAGTDTIDVVLHRLAQLGAEYGNPVHLPTWELLQRAAAATTDRPAHVFIDEVQDCTPRELQLAARLASHGKITAVGDPMQAVYQWRGAAEWGEVEAILNPSETHHLTHSFRFGGVVAAEATRVSAMAGGQPVVGRPDRDTGISVVGWHEDWHQPLTGGQKGAVLCRTNRQCAQVVGELQRRGVAAAHATRDKSDWRHSAADAVHDAWGQGNVVVSTVHSFKGLEADVVVAYDWLGERDPTQGDVRLWFVAITRAKHELVTVRGGWDW